MVSALESSGGSDDECRASATFRGESRNADLRAGASIESAPLTYARFVALIDRCVRHLAWGFDVDSRDAGPACDDGDSHAAEAARIQLWRWLHDGGATLDDGTPVGFALFDETLQRSSERLPRRGRAHQHVTRAAWLLAELIHAPTMAPQLAAANLLFPFPVSPSRYPIDAASD